MYFHVVGFSRGLLASLLVLIVALPQNVFAQAPHLVTPAELHRELLTAARMREQNRQTVRQFLSSEAGKNALRVVHSDPVEVTRAIATLSDAELAQLAQRADKSQRDFAAGALSKEALLIVAIAVIVVVIIVAVKI